MRRVIKRMLWSLLVLIGAVVISAAIAFGPMTYAALVGYKHYETVPSTLPEDLGGKAILIFSKTNGFRDDGQIKAANAALADIARRRGWSSYTTENAAVFNPAQLRRFRTVVWNSVSGDVLTTEQRAAFKSWLEQGGGFVGLHGAGGDPSYAWKWYVDDLVGTQFIGHTLNPHIQQARLLIEDPHHPATKDLGPSWTRSDEWYSFRSSPRSKGYHILVTIDEASYRPVEGFIPFLKPKDISMGKDHPLVWSHCVGRGRAIYSALGHTAESYAEPKHQQLIGGAISWAAGFEGPACVSRTEQPQENRPVNGAPDPRRAGAHP
ncbi:ThuA domain-containing protein [Novosphingobium sp. G106]|uniref:ThuA domain-containing protein n=1 Tax=Novosphingobium sp. G106 TaxID=2849500 RepID=UPI001C2DE730|nr:ThuA domain-containing protein [Novosphingobium sp. G106]MBV1687921.1 ThuA domain-containing protein [Novosphingobium sp. G106]